MADDTRGEFVAHRHTIAARSGDAHVIGADGVARNVDQAARDQALAELTAPVLGEDGKPLNPPAGTIADEPATILPTRSGKTSGPTSGAAPEFPTDPAPAPGA